jgi:hypothetical protein
MGQSQLLIIALSVLIIGIAILAGTGFFSADDVEANKKAMMNDILHVAISARRYYARPATLAGGNYTYSGYVVPVRYQSTDNGMYSASLVNPQVLAIKGVSDRDTSNQMTAWLDATGKTYNWKFTGDFSEN